MRELCPVIRLLREAGVTILLVEQNMKLAEAVADELHIMVKGRMVYRATPPASAPRKRQSGALPSLVIGPEFRGGFSGPFQKLSEVILGGSIRRQKRNPCLSVPACRLS